MVAVVSRAAWGAAFEIPAGRHVNPSARREVVIHWPGSAVGADPAAVVRAIERSHRQGNGWQAAPGYNFLIGGGRIFEGCGRDVRGIHVGVGNINTTAWGICVLQGVGQPVAQADLNACRALIDWLCHVAGRDLARSSHGHHMATQCAGPALNGWVNAGMPATAPPPPPPPPTGGPPAWPGRILRQPPIMRGDDVRTWQAAARGLTVDGAYGPLSEARCRQIQAAADLPVDGRVGPNTWPATWRDHQPGPAPAPPPPPPPPEVPDMWILRFTRSGRTMTYTFNGQFVRHIPDATTQTALANATPRIPIVNVTEAALRSFNGGQLPAQLP